ncbi:MAG: ABC transporter ATP-binding protein [Azospirillaceae bacterium]
MTIAAGPHLLTLEGVEAAYGDSRILFAVDLAVGAGEVVSLLGRNGMGKTTTVRAILGLTPPRAGRVIFDGADLAGAPPHRIAKAGIGLVPEGRQIFPTLTVEENLIATAADRHGKAGPWTLERVYALFPRLAERRGQRGAGLSGGEQQMLAIARALMTAPRLLILDEATEGLAPLVRREIWAALDGLRGEGQSILIIDKSLDALMRLADRHAILEKGRIVWTGDSRALSRAPDVVDCYLGL